MPTFTRRQASYAVLDLCKDHTLNAAFDSFFSKWSLEKQEKSFIQFVVYHVFRYRNRFQALLALYAKKPEDISPKALNILYVALVELLHSSGSSYAIINEAVEESKKVAPRESSLINALLRKIAENKALYCKEELIPAFKKQFPQKNNLEILSLYASIPFFLVDTYKKQYGLEQTEIWLENVNSTPYYGYRINGKHPEIHSFIESFTTEPEAPFAFVLPHLLENAQEYHKKGLISSQGISSQIACQILKDTFSQELNGLWDPCCGFGNKSLALMEQGIEVAFASDPSISRIEGFKGEISRLNVSSPEIFVSTLEEANIEKVPCILLDAPCSGSGTLCRNPDLRYSITKQVFAEKAAFQQNLLEKAWDKLENKGILCYITCSFHKNENENNIDLFKESHTLKEELRTTIESKVPGADRLFLSVLRKI